MNNHSKTMLAVFAVIIMVGSTFVPLAAGDSNGSISVQSRADEENEGTFTDFVNAIETLKENFSAEQNVSGTVFVPIDAPDDYVESPSADAKTITIKEETTIGDGEVLELRDSNTYEFKDEGRYVIGNGGKLVLAGLEGDWGFYIHNYRISTAKGGFTNLVCLNSGAMVCFMGVWFKVITAYDTQSLIKCGNDTDVIFRDKPDTENAEKRLVLVDVRTRQDGTPGKMTLLDFIHVDDNEKKSSEFTLKGKITNDINDDGKTYLKFSDCDLSMRAVIRGTGVMYSMKAYVECKISDFNTTLEFGTWDYATKPTQPEFDLTIKDLSFKIDSMVVTVSNVLFEDMQLAKIIFRKITDKDLEITISGMKIAKACVIGASENAVTSIQSHRTISADSVKMTGYGNLSLNILGMYKITTHMRGIEFGFTGFSMKTDSVFSPAVKSQLLDSLKFSIVFNADKFRIWGNDFTELTASLNNFSYTLENGVVKITTGTSVLKSKLVPAGAKNSFDVVFDFSNFALDDKGFLKGNVSFDATTVLDGAERQYVAKLTGFGINIVGGNDAPTLKCEKVAFENNVPMNKVYPTVEGAQSFIGYFVVEGAEMKGMTFGAKYGKADFNVLNNGIVDRIGFEINGDFTATPGLNLLGSYLYVQIKSSHNLTGYTQNVGGEKKNFSVEAVSSNGIDVSVIMYSDEKAVTVGIDEGKANFSNGGLIPAKLYIGENAEFVGNNVSAMAFEFNCDSSKRSGTVMFDLSDGYTMSKRYIDYDYSQITVNRTKVVDGVIKDYGGYVISFDVSDFSSGKIVAKNGNILRTEYREFDYEGFENMNIVDSTSATFTLDSSYMHNLTVKCIGDVYVLYICDEYGKVVDSHLMLSKETYTLEGIHEHEGYNLIGWNDGSKFLKGTVEGKSIIYDYTMPTRNVFITPVYAEKAVVTDNKVVTDAPAVEIPKDQSGAIDDGFTIVTNGATIEMNGGAVDQIKTALENTDKVIINVTEIVDQNTKAQKSIATDNALYGIEITDGNGDSINYSQQTEFEVTLSVVFSGNISTFRVSYIDENGHTISVPLKGYEYKGSNTYDVTFTVNHFSEYVVEPVYVPGDATFAYAAVVCVLILTLGYVVYTRMKP